jgi:hypothetical protein
LNKNKNVGQGGIPVKNYIFSSLSGQWLILLWKVSLTFEDKNLQTLT